ncbi:MAG: hypothetical protein M3Q08_18685 [Pseudomonadota bacterium]|nr:hypothetical protein [Pseudomonadota bacterium]
MEPNYELMRAVDRRYQQHTGLASRAHYSIFYGPLAKNNLLVLNANPGGTPANYKIVDVMSGHHEYIEGRNSGATTANGAKILQYIAGTATRRRSGVYKY